MTSTQLIGRTVFLASDVETALGIGPLHDGFLLESEAIGTTIKEALALTAPVPTAQD